MSFSSPLFAFSDPIRKIMTKPAQDKAAGAETWAEHIVFNKDVAVMRREAWRARIADELNSGDERVEQMRFLPMFAKPKSTTKQGIRNTRMWW